MQHNVHTGLDESLSIYYYYYYYLGSIFTQDVGRRNRMASKPEYGKRRWKVKIKKIKTHLLEEMETGNWNFWFQAVYGRCRVKCITLPILYIAHIGIMSTYFVAILELRRDFHGKQRHRPIQTMKIYIITYSIPHFIN